MTITETVLDSGYGQIIDTSTSRVADCDLIGSSGLAFKGQEDRHE